jgi:hypothetical protein
MTREEIAGLAGLLKQRVLDHDVIQGRAVVILPAREADELAGAILKLLEESK